MATFNRQLRREARATRLKILKQMRRDLIYLIKPKPKFIPQSIWMWLLGKLVNLKSNEVANANK